jgi:hypothetical protein
MNRWIVDKVSMLSTLFKTFFKTIALALGNIPVWHKDALCVYESFATGERLNLLADFYDYLDTVDDEQLPQKKREYQWLIEEKHVGHQMKLDNCE